MDFPSCTAATMADTQPATEALATNPAEAQAVAKPDATVESSEPGETEGTNGTAEPSKDEESSKNDRSNGRKFDNRRGGRGGNFHGSNKRFKYVDIKDSLRAATHPLSGAMTNSRTCPSQMTPTRLDNK